jgi:Tol biopolymer transport system component
MPLPAGTRLGTYEILAPLGAGGMGEVYKAKDQRLRREVAVKVLPSSFATDPDRLRRFEQEAQAAGALNHPNITAVYELGSHEGSPYIVTELLEGETLRERLRTGRLPARKSIDYARQIANGLGAAHDKGIVHRDLKPENLFLTKDGRIKILDFGLAKLTRPEQGESQTDLSTETGGTEPGVVMGTVGYMSPEQVRGRPADHRSDVFSFGAILYEMLTGKRAFHGASAADTMSAILEKDPPELSLLTRELAPGLEQIARRCLEKEPSNRFQSSGDLAWSLETLGATSGPATASAAARPRIEWRAIATVVLALAAAAAGYFVNGRAGREEPRLSMRRITFRPGLILSARFGPDGGTIFFSAAVEDQPSETYATVPPARESRPLGLSGSQLLAVSSQGELAALLKERGGAETLVRVPQSGGSPREVLRDIGGADWGPDGQLAILRTVSGKQRIEYPPGALLYESEGMILSLRVSPRGDFIALCERAFDEDVETLRVVDRQRRSRELLRMSDLHEPSWSPDGREVLVSASEDHANENHSVVAVGLDGRRRTLITNGLDLKVLDVSPDGRLLATREDFEGGMRFITADGRTERELAWFDASVMVDLSPNGDTVLFQEGGLAIGILSTGIYLRRTDGSPAIRLGDGEALALSPDGRWVLAITNEKVPSLLLLPTGAGQPRPIEVPGVRLATFGAFMPDGHSVLVVEDVEQDGRIWSVDVETGKAQTLPGRLADFRVIAPDGRRVVARRKDGGLEIRRFDEGPSTALPDTDRMAALQWSGDGRFLYLCRRGEIPLKVLRYEIASGKSEPWASLRPSNLPAVTSVFPPRITRDGRFIGYTYFRARYSHAVVVEGLERQITGRGPGARG